MHDDQKRQYLETQMVNAESSVFAQEVELEALKAEAKAAPKEQADSFNQRIENTQYAIEQAKARQASYKSQLAKLNK